MTENRTYIVEFLVVAAIVALGMFGLVTMALAHAGDSLGVVDSLRSIVTAGFGALIALAYAARGQKPPEGK